MMCAQRLQRIFTAIFLGVILYFFAKGHAGDQQSFQIAVVMQFFVMVVSFVWAFTNFNATLWALRKTFPDCQWKEE